jgi:hypothetical protein
VTDQSETAGCPWCGHAIEGHEIQAGHPVCTRGRERPSCRACAGIRDALAEARPLTFAGVMRHPPSVQPWPLVYGRPLRAGVTHPPATVPDVR